MGDRAAQGVPDTGVAGSVDVRAGEHPDICLGPSFTTFGTRI